MRLLYSVLVGLVFTTAVPVLNTLSALVLGVSAGVWWHRELKR